MSDQIETVTHPAMPLGERTPNPKAPDVLVMNRRKGVFLCDHLEPLPPRATEKEPYKVHRLILKPGLNLAPGGLWAQLKKHNGQIQLAADEGTLAEIGTPANWHKQDRGQQIRQVLSTSDPGTLESLVPGAKGDVVEALEDQIEELRRKDEEEADQRRERRRLNRRKKYGNA